MKERLESGKPNINIPESPCSPGYFTNYVQGSFVNDFWWK